MATSLLIESTDAQNKKLQKAVTNLNPEATNYQLKTFAQKLNGLTTNTYVGVVRVDRDDISDATGDTDPNFSISPTSIAADSQLEDGKTVTIQLTYDGDTRNVTFSGKKPRGCSFSVSDKTVTIKAPDFAWNLQQNPTTATATFTLAAGGEYKAATATVTFTGLDAQNYVDI